LPVVMYTEGGGGRPGDIDVKTQIAGLDVPTFSSWAGLKGKNPLIVVNNGYCFAGNAALFGCGDVRIATKSSWIGMAGPAMIEGGGLGLHKPNDIGPSDIHFENGIIDLLAEDESQATELAKKCLSFIQGDVNDFEFSDQSVLKDIMPLNRQQTYDIRKVAHTLADADSFLELTSGFGKTILTAFARIEGKAVGLIASNCESLGGAIDADGAMKASRFFHICNVFKVPIVSLVDTPGFMVGPESEKQGAVNHMTGLFVAGAKLETSLVCIFLRKGYGLGAMAMAGGSFKMPRYTVSWPTGEFGAMGIEGAVKLGFKKELESVEDGLPRDNLFADLVDKMYDRGRATEAASFLEIDAVIDPSESRSIIARVLKNKLM
jgi:acetyl-CoA carboxylase carboxyltransferase component